MKLHERLAAMREYITEHGLCKFMLEDDAGQVCLRGALWKVRVSRSEESEVDKFLADLAIEMSLWPGPNVPVTSSSGMVRIYRRDSAHVYFNNHPDTTEQDVIDFLHTAEVRAKEQA